MELDSEIQTSKDILKQKTNTNEFVIDETLIKVGSEYIWLWIAIEFESKEIVGFGISKERNMFAVERLLSKIIDEYGKHLVSTDGGTWYPQACRFLKVDHHIHSSLMRKALLKERYNISKIEQNHLMTIFLAVSIDVN